MSTNRRTLLAWIAAALPVMLTLGGRPARPKPRVDAPPPTPGGRARSAAHEPRVVVLDIDRVGPGHHLAG